MENKINPPLGELKHHGVKGMRWGVRAAGIRAARNSVAKTHSALEKEQVKFIKGKSTKAQVAKVKMAHLQNPDRSTAVLLTAGEKAAVAVLFTPAGAAATIATARAASKVIESKQKRRA